MKKISLFENHAKSGENHNKFSRSVSYETLVGGTTTECGAYEQTQCLSKGSADAPLTAVGTLTSQLCCSAKVVEKSLQTLPVFRLVKILSLVAVLAMGMLSESRAKECNCGEVGHESDCCWEIDSNGVLHITAADGKSNVRMANYEMINEYENEDSFIVSSSAPWANSNATKAVVGDGIGYIGSYAFTSTMGIGTKAESINNATDMNLWDTDYKVNGITEVSGMNTVTEIGTSAFESGATLNKVDMPNVTTIGEYAFSGTSLTSVDIPNVTTIGSDAFSGASSLESIDMPNVTTIGESAFEGATSLTSVDMPNVETIGMLAFSGATSLTSVDMPNVKNLGHNVFIGATSLEYVGLPAIDSEGYLIDEEGQRIKDAQNNDIKLMSTTCHYYPFNGIGNPFCNEYCVGGSCSMRVIDGIANCTTVNGYQTCGSCNSSDGKVLVSGRGCVTATTCELSSNYYWADGSCNHMPTTQTACTESNYGWDSANSRCMKNWTPTDTYLPSVPTRPTAASCTGQGMVLQGGKCVSTCGASFRLNDGECDRIRYTPAEAAQYLKDTDNEIIMTFKVNR